MITDKREKNSVVRVIYGRARFGNKNNAPQRLPVVQLFLFHPQNYPLVPKPISLHDDAISILPKIISIAQNPFSRDALSEMKQRNKIFHMNTSGTVKML